MLTIFSKYKLNLIVVLLLSIILKLLSLAVQKLVFLADIKIVNALVSSDPKESMEVSGIDLVSFTSLIIMSGFAGVITLIIVSIYSGYKVRKYGFHWLNSLASLLLVYGLTLLGNSKKGWHIDIGFFEIPGYLFKDHPYLYFLLNGLLYLLFGLVILKLCMLYVRKKAKRVEP